MQQLCWFCKCVALANYDGFVCISLISDHAGLFATVLVLGGKLQPQRDGTRAVMHLLLDLLYRCEADIVEGGPLVSRTTDSVRGVVAGGAANTVDSYIARLKSQTL